MPSEPPPNSAPVTPPRRKLPVEIWVLGMGSLFMDISSEMIHSLLPVFLTSVLGTSLLTIGILEGIAEATAAVTKVFSGAFSDWLGKRKLPLVLGYALAACTKPIFPLAHSISWIFAGRFIDRLGKGIRGAPRDALVADVTPLHLRGRAYGLRQALDSTGALLGPLLAVACMFWFAEDIRAVMWVGVLPAFIAVALLILYIREPSDSREQKAKAALTFRTMGQLPQRYWLVVALGALFTLARFSEAFLVLRASDVGLALAYVPVVMVVMNLCYAAGAYPAGAAADRISRRSLLLSGLAVLIIADFVLAVAASPMPALIGAALWGIHMALTQGLFAKLVADTAPANLRGTAFGIFNLVTGGALLAASLIAGALWNTYGPIATFLAGALFALLAAVGLLAYNPKSRLAPTIPPGS